MAKRLYLVQSLRESAEVMIAGQIETTIDFTGMADGCAGVMLAFTNKRNANRYAKWFKQDPGISTFEIVPTEPKKGK